MKHKFINKKTGAEARVMAMYLDSDGVMQVDGYDTVEELMDDYAAYEEYNPPKEPLIKDEKIRKAVRAWAEANSYFENIEIHSLVAGTRFSIGHYDIEFIGYFIYDLESNKSYTIAELCGEEEEC